MSFGEYRWAEAIYGSRAIAEALARFYSSRLSGIVRSLPLESAMNDVELWFKMQSIFSPHEAERRGALLQKNKRLIHYTSAANALSIIGNNVIWMRNVRCMNDFREVEHGLDMLVRASNRDQDSEAEKGLIELRAELDKIMPDAAGAAISRFNQWLDVVRDRTYVACLSEHDPTENDIGRLSMWRSYGSGQVGIGFVINPAPFYSLDDGFGAYSSPVYYLDDEKLLRLFIEIRNNIIREAEFIKQQDPALITSVIFQLLRSIAICSKHPGFHEEQEWRIMHTEDLDPKGALRMNVECVNGVPQKVFKIPLEERPDIGMMGISIPNFLERVIIGPTQYPLAVYEAIVHELEAKHVPNAREKVVFSNIPIRT